MSSLAGRREHRGGRAVTAGFAFALAAGMLVAGIPAAHAASSPTGHVPAAARRAAGPRLLSSAAASARAQATGKPVVVSSLTTATTQTTAKPGGLFTVAETLLPVRAYRNGAWRALNPDLCWNANHTLTPAVTTSGLALSGGGNGPLAVMTSHGRSMSLWWPSTLPVPALSGATATYANVLPGVNLVVTANPQGGFSDVLVIKDAAAAAAPALASLRLTARAPNLHFSVADGNLRVAASASAQPAFSAQAPQMWDSAPPAPGTAIVHGPGGALVAAPSGMPASSTVVAPGAGAHVSEVPLSASGDTITLTPPHADLTARGLVYPIFIDPSFDTDPVSGKADNWTQVDSGFATTSYWNESSDLQLGYCDFSTCNGLGVVRDFITMPISTELAKTTHINSAYMYMTDAWSASCTKESVQLWTTGPISSSTTWNKQPAFLTDLQNQSFAYGYDSSCAYYAKDVTWTVTSVVQADAGKVSAETFGLKAGSESNDLYWKQFESGASNITITTNFHNPPNKPSGLENAPAGSCATSYASESTIGADDVTLSATVGDVDNANGDDSLATTFTVKSYSTGDTVDTIKVDSGNAAGGVTVSTDIARSVVEGWGTNGTTTEYSYYWYATTSDAGSPVLTSPQSDTCYFLYDPVGPAAPGVSVNSSTVTIGTQFSATFTPQSGCSATTTPCPATFTYQLGAGAPVTVTPNNSPATGDWTGNITMGHVGPVQLTVYGTAAGGNPGTSFTVGLTGGYPATPYLDGYFAGGSYPSMLTEGTGKDPSLWLSVGTGNGTLAPSVDIGSLGTMINPGADGPADWSDAKVLHGDFTGNDVQDVMAYYTSGTHAGNAVIIGGQGDASPLVPADNWAIPSVALADPFFANPADYPTVLVGAGDASETATGIDDLIGVLGDPTSGYELDLFSVSGAGECGGDDVTGGYGYCQTLSTMAPDGSADWNNYALATAQPAGNSDAVVLFALDKATGALYVSINSTCNETASSPVTTGCEQGASNTLVGMPGTWTKLTDPWGATAPDLVSADMNNAGSVELWAVSGGTAIPYTVNFGTDAVAQEGSGSALAYPSDDWQLNDGSNYAFGSSATTATDSVTAAVATVYGTCTGTCFWGDDSYFSTAAQFDGTNTYVAPPAGIIPPTATSASISVWFKTTSTDAVIASVQASAISSGSTISGGYNPILYVGSDGYLQADWWPAQRLASKAPVNDGLWHHAVFTNSGDVETLTLDGVTQTGINTVSFSYATSTHVDFGAGYLGGNWPDEPHQSTSSNEGYLYYFKGQIADVSLVP